MYTTTFVDTMKVPPYLSSNNDFFYLFSLIASHSQPELIRKENYKPDITTMWIINFLWLPPELLHWCWKRKTLNSIRLKCILFFLQSFVCWFIQTQTPNWVEVFPKWKVCNDRFDCITLIVFLRFVCTYSHIFIICGIYWIINVHFHRIVHTVVLTLHKFHFQWNTCIVRWNRTSKKAHQTKRMSVCSMRNRVLILYSYTSNAFEVIWVCCMLMMLLLLLVMMPLLHEYG